LVSAYSRLSDNVVEMRKIFAIIGGGLGIAVLGSASQAAHAAFTMTKISKSLVRRGQVRFQQEGKSLGPA
jgi:hypothetical protein